MRGSMLLTNESVMYLKYSFSNKYFRIHIGRQMSQVITSRYLHSVNGYTLSFSF